MATGEMFDLFWTSSSLGPDEPTSGHKDCLTPTVFEYSCCAAFGGNGTPKVIAAECGWATGIR